MNLFRSEESVRAWPDFDPKTEKSIKPVREWAGMMTGARVFQKRLDDDFVERSNEYGNEALGALAKALSRTIESNVIGAPRSSETLLILPSAGSTIDWQTSARNWGSLLEHLDQGKEPSSGLRGGPSLPKEVGARYQTRGGRAGVEAV